MATFGCLARYFRPFESEVAFARANGFAFLQLWYDHRGLCLDGSSPVDLDRVRNAGIPTIIHAVMELQALETGAANLLDTVQVLDHRELIIHPVCQSEPSTTATTGRLSAAMGRLLAVLQHRGVTVYLENNSRLDPIFQTVEDVGHVLGENPDLEFLLDVAHMDDLVHLRRLVAIKRPRLLHVADRHLAAVHEHLPIGEGDIHFGAVFREILPDYRDRIILEIVQSDEAIITSKEKLEGLLAAGMAGSPS